MIIGIPKETERLEHRVGLTPFAVRRLCQQGHAVLVEKEAGAAGHFADRDFTGAGAEVVYTPEEVYKRADLHCPECDAVVCICPPQCHPQENRHLSRCECSCRAAPPPFMA